MDGNVLTFNWGVMQMQKKAIIAILIMLSACQNSNKPEAKLEEKNDSAVTDKDTIAVETHNQTELDSTLYNFAKNNLNPGLHSIHVRYKYKAYRDTLTYKPEDSIIIYQYPIDSIADHYDFPFEWAENINEHLEGSIIKAKTDFIAQLKKASFCQGIIYSEGDQMIESFRFNSEDEAQKAKELFDSTNYYIFIKTLSFAVNKKNYLYVFHARYMGPSWHLKRDFEKFENLINPIEQNL